MRIRWRGVARAAAIVLVALLALRMLPGLLRAPEPPPLGADVGLPKAKPAASRRIVVNAPPKATKPVAPKHARKPRPKLDAVPGAAASTAKIGTRTRRPDHRRPKPSPAPTPPPAPVEPAPSPDPEYVAPAAPGAAPETLPEPSPAPRSTPGDGSQEFMPR